MTEILLIDAISERLREIFKGYMLLNKDRVLQEVKIFAQYMAKPKVIQNIHEGILDYTSDDYLSNMPCIVVQLVNCVDYEENRNSTGKANVKILTSIIDEADDCQGWRDILNIHDKIRENFLVNRILKDIFLLNMPVESRLLDVDTWPVFTGEINLEFAMARPIMQQFVYHGRAY